jgi:hypothetical protein
LGEEADKAASNFTALIASAYRLSTSKVPLSDVNSNLCGLGLLSKHRQRMRELWHEAWDCACKMAVNRVTKTIRRITHRKALEQLETKTGN